MNRNQSYHRGRMAVVCLISCLLMIGISGRLFYLMVFCSEHYSQMAEDLHQRERPWTYRRRM